MDREEIVYTYTGIRTDKEYKFSFKLLKFELLEFFNFLFQYPYTFIAGFRFICDSSPFRYFLFYNSLVLAIIFTDYGYILSYITIGIIGTKLLVYFSENSFQAITTLWTSKGTNQKLLTHNLRITKKNIMTYMFWNLRDIDIDDTKFDHEIYPSKYCMSSIYPMSVAYKFNDLKVAVVGYNELNLDYKDYPKFTFTFKG